MIMEDIFQQELINSGTSKTKNEQFDKNGYLLVENLVDIQELICEVPNERGNLKYFGSLEKYIFEFDKGQVAGSFERWDYPPYEKFHYIIKKKLESIIGEDLYPTYYYDRFYFPGQKLDLHLDRPACEISVTMHIRTNLKDPWPFCIKGCDTYNENKTQVLDSGQLFSAILKPGDVLIYKGCERPHWREPMPGVKRNKVRKLIGKEELFYHQIFFHYVLANGNRAHHAWNMIDKNNA